MSVTVSVDDPGVRVTDEAVEAVPPGAIEFSIEGTAAVSGGLLGEFEGKRLRPVAVEVSVDDSTVTVDLRGDAALRLETVDVGVQTPGADDLLPGADGPESPTSAVSGVPSPEAGAVAFAVEGSITGIPPETFVALSGERPRIQSITFAVDDPRASDGGTGDDVLLEVTVLGFRILIRRDGTVTIGGG